MKVTSTQNLSKKWHGFRERTDKNGFNRYRPVPVGFGEMLESAIRQRELIDENDKRRDACKSWEH